MNKPQDYEYRQVEMLELLRPALIELDEQGWTISGPFRRVDGQIVTLRRLRPEVPNA